MPVTLKNILLAIFGGLLCWAAWPTSWLFPLIFVAWIPILLIEDSFSEKEIPKSARKLFGYAFIFFIVWNISTTWWVKNASFGGSIAAFILNSLFMCIPFILFHKTKKRFGAAIGYFALVSLWLTYEYAHQNWELTWPWLVLGNVFANFPQLVQWYEFTGSSGGTLWVLCLNILLFLQLKKLRANSLEVNGLPDILKIYFGFSWKPLLLFTLPIVVSLILFKSYEEQGEAVEIVVLQPNIDAYEKFERSKQKEYINKFVAMSDSLISDKTEFLVWPETSLPNTVWLNKLESNPSIKKCRELLAKHPDLTLITGATIIEQYDSKATATARPFRNDPERFYDVYNGAMELNGENLEIEQYIKSKLVPGVERMPYPGLFKFLGDYAIDLGGTAGSLGMQNEREVFTDDEGIKVAPVICYESVFAEYVTDYIKLGADFIFIITNDDWWGDTPGHRQHLRYASLRAIENRRAIARSANTGISAFIDQRGIIHQATTYKNPAVIKQKIKANKTLTFFSRHGDIISRLSIFCSVLLILNLMVGRFTKGFMFASIKRKS